jgi:hypothetical protein
MRVEFRLLQLLLSHDSGDRLTLALLHWDGAQLRVASSMASLIALDVRDREPLRATAREWVRRAESTAARIRHGQGELDLGLQNLFPVRAGVGSSLLWTAVTTVDVRSASEHFDELRTSLRLEPPVAERHRRVTDTVLRHQLEALGESLAESLGESGRLRVRQSVEGSLKYTPPVSWKNGLWHHAIPASFDALDAAQVAEHVERLHGLVSLAIPRGEVPMVVVALPSSTAHAEAVTYGLSLLQPLLDERHGRWLAPPRTRGTFAFDDLERLIRHDVTTGAD